MAGRKKTSSRTHPGQAKAMRLGGIRIPKNPISLKTLECECTYLGEVLEVELADRVARFPKACHLIYFPESKLICFFEGTSVEKMDAMDGDEMTKAGIKASEWNNEDIEWSAKLTLPTGKEWWSFGNVARLDYWSSKWGRDDEYTHAIDHYGRVKMYGSASKNGITFFVKGLEVTSRGIEG